MVHVSISFDKQQYSPLDTVSVKVDVHLAKPEKICSIKIAAVGNAAVQWREPDSKTYKKYSSGLNYFSRREFFLFCLHGEEVELPPGMHTYHYSFILPSVCDSSYRKGIGEIKYECIVQVVRPFNKRSCHTERFNVHRPIDLRELYRIATPVTKSVESHFLPFKKGSITMKAVIRVRLPAEANQALYPSGAVINEACYLPGETIHLETSIFNRSPRTIRQICVCLVEATTYTARAEHNFRQYQFVNKEEIRFRQSLHVAAGSDYCYSRDIVICEITPIHNTWKNINVQYYVKVMLLSIFGTVLSFKIPIVIGTIPHSNPPGAISQTISDASQPEEGSSPPSASEEGRVVRTDSDETSSFYSLSDGTIDAPDLSMYNDRSPLVM